MTEFAPIPETLADITIDGCLVPSDVYRRVHSKACATGRTQFIGVVYHQPAELRAPQFPGRAHQPALDWDWEAIMHRDAMRRLHFRRGEHLEYITGEDREALLARHDLAMILWINPWAN